MIRIAATGHRYDKLYGYNLKDSRYMTLYIMIYSRIFKAIKEDEEHKVECITGMALGVDTIFAIAAINLKLKGHNVHLVAAIPFKGQELKWNDDSIEIYNNILKYADEIVYVCNGGYAPYKMQKRNEYMVDRLIGVNDILLAIYNGSTKGGTANCVNYAKSLDINIEYINPLEVLA